MKTLASVEGWVLFGFNGNTSTKEVYIDFVRDENGNYIVSFSGGVESTGKTITKTVLS